jgi:glutamyl-tRNA synthetase
MYLRIEDTDKKRSRKIYTQDIIKGLGWLGLGWDDKIIYQTDRLKLYQRYVDQLLEKNLAYKSDEAIWFKVKGIKDLPARVEFRDLIRGKISFPIAKLKDFVIVASNKMPLFLLTNVIDDYEMEISHVIRGEDHISNTPRQILLQRALGLSSPRYAHIPLILAPDRSKLSKRTGAVSVLEYRKMGILPEALVNFLGLLGFHPSGDKEIFSLEELTEIFSLKRIQKSGAIFDQQKLLNLNSRYIRAADKETLEKQIKKFSSIEMDSQKFSRSVAITKERLKTLAEFDEAAAFLKKLGDYPADRLIFKKSTRTDTKEALEKVYQSLRRTASAVWKKESNLKEIFERVVEKGRWSNGDVFWSARVALSGLEHSPQPSEIAWALGKRESLTRIKKAIGKLTR